MGGELIYQIYRSKVATWAHQASRWDDLGERRPYQACLREQCVVIIIILTMRTILTVLVCAFVQVQCPHLLRPHVASPDSQLPSVEITFPRMCGLKRPVYASSVRCS